MLCIQLSVVVSACLRTPPPSNGDVYTRIRTRLEGLRKANSVSGMGVAVVSEGKVVFLAGFGASNVALGLAVTPDTSFAIGSLTKGFTGLLLAQAQSEGRLALADSPRKYIPNFRLKDPLSDAKVCLSDLLSHRTGLPRADMAWATGSFSRDELVRVAALSEQTSALGTRWQYSNLMYVFAGMAAEAAYGKSYEALVKQRFFDPLGMAHSTASTSEFVTDPLHAIGYVSEGSCAELLNTDVISPAGGIASTTRDMANYLTMLLSDGKFGGKQVFAASAIAETRKPWMSLRPFGPSSYGLGWMLSRWRGQAILEHDGALPGYASQIVLMPETRLGVVVLTNSSDGSLAALASRAALSELLPPSIQAPAITGTPIPNTLIGRFVGQEIAYDVRLSSLKGQGILSLNGTPLPLTPIGAGTYRSSLDGYDLTLGYRNDTKTVCLDLGSGQVVLRRVPVFKPPMTPGELLARAVRARGGVVNLRRHPNLVSHVEGSYPSDGLDVAGYRYQRGAAGAEFYALYGLGQKRATLQIFCDGRESFFQISPNYTDEQSGSDLSDAILARNTLADLEPARWYKSLEVVGETVIGGENVYVLEKIPFAGSLVTDYLSKASYQLLRRDVGYGPLPIREEYGDFRTLDGLVMPYHIIRTEGDNGPLALSVVSIRFDERVPDWVFKH